MKQNIIHIGLDVDDTQYHGSAFNKDTGEVVDFISSSIADLIQGHQECLCIDDDYRGW